MKSSLAYRTGAILWSHLPEDCRKAISLGNFIYLKAFTSRMQLKIYRDFSNLHSEVLDVFTRFTVKTSVKLLIVKELI